MSLSVCAPARIFRSPSSCSSAQNRGNRRLRSAFPPLPAIRHRESAELDEARLVGVQLERELGHSFPEVVEKLLRIRLALAANDEVSRPGESHQESHPGPPWQTHRLPLKPDLTPAAGARTWTAYAGVALRRRALLLRPAAAARRTAVRYDCRDAQGVRSDGTGRGGRGRRPRRGVDQGVAPADSAPGRLVAEERLRPR